VIFLFFIVLNVSCIFICVLHLFITSLQTLHKTRHIFVTITSTLCLKKTIVPKYVDSGTLSLYTTTKKLAVEYLQ